MTIEGLLALIYCLFLLTIAWGLACLARKNFRKGDPYLARNFRYRQELDVLECPQGEYMIPIDEEDKEISYKAIGETCRGCELEKFCTDHQTFQEMANAQPWIQQEMGQFYRGMSLTVLLITGFILSIFLLAYGGGLLEKFMLGIMLLTTAALGMRNLRSLRIQ